MKKILSVLLLVALFLTVTGCSSTQPQATEPVQTEDVRLWWAYPTENFIRDGYYDDLERDSTLRFHSIKGETESIQLMITPQEDVKNFDISVSDVKNENGDVIDKDNFEIFVNWYILTEGYCAEHGYGEYPDALVPLKASKRAKENYIDALDNQGIWINLNVPEDAAPGFYTGTVEVELDKEEYEVPVEVTVYDAQMPEQVHPKSAFAVWYDYISRGEGTYTTELADAYFWFLIDKRVMTTNVEPIKYNDPNLYMEFMVENLAMNPKVSSYNLPYKVGSEDGYVVIDENSVVNLLNMMVDKNISLRKAGDDTTDLFKKAYYYLGNICDEPHTPEAIEKTRRCDLIISQSKLKVAERLNDYPDLKESLLGIQHVVTTMLLPDLIGTDTQGGVQTWCPTFENFQGEDMRQAYYDRRNNSERIMGEGIWWYGCIIPRAPYPNYHMDDSLVVPRIISWMQYDYEIEGILYWAVNYYDHYSQRGRDVWTDAGSWDDIMCEGQLVYPGSKYGIFGPISTCRLESIRDGLEDYEYFWMIEQMVTAYNEENGTSYKTQELLSGVLDGLYNGMISTRDPEAFHQHRLLLLDILQRMCANRDVTIESLAD